MTERLAEQDKESAKKARKNNMAQQPKPFVFGTDMGSAGGFVFEPLKPKAEEEDAAKKPEEESEEKDKEEAEREAAVDFEPVVRLETVHMSNNEENEDVIFKMRSKLFRFDKEAGEWKERCIGDARLMEHKETHKVRLLIRQEKTLKVRCNHYVMPGMELKENSGSDRSWMWTCPMDYAEEPRPEIFAIRFANHESLYLMSRPTHPHPEQKKASQHSTFDWNARQTQWSSRRRLRRRARRTARRWPSRARTRRRRRRNPSKCWSERGSSHEHTRALSTSKSIQILTHAQHHSTERQREREREQARTGAALFIAGGGASSTRGAQAALLRASAL